MILRCTAKLLKEMGLSRLHEANDNPQQPILSDWHANLFFLSRKKNIIFCDSGTFFTLVSFNVRRDEIRNIGRLFRNELVKTLLDEDIDGTTIQQVMDANKEIELGPTRDRKVLGIMVDHVKNLRCMIEAHNIGWNYDKLSVMARDLNRAPLFTSTRNACYAIDNLGRQLNVKVNNKIDFNF